MNTAILIVVLAILAETSFLMLRGNRQAKKKQRRIFIDTSVLIDGRIIGVAKTGFVDGTIVILESVLKELQLLADGKDSTKRNRARAGLERAFELQTLTEIKTEIIEDNVGKQKVDDQLLKYAKKEGGLILTIDYNLIMVAEAEGVDTLNINDLALAVRTEFLPGESAFVKITDKGSGYRQGVGHLPDGTMVVVDDAISKINKTIKVTFVRTLETSAGKILFAKKA